MTLRRLLAIPLIIAAMASVLLVGLEIWFRVAGVLSGGVPLGDAILNGAVTAAALLVLAMILTAIAIRLDPTLEPGYVDPRLVAHRREGPPPMDEDESHWNPYG